MYNYVEVAICTRSSGVAQNTVIDFVMPGQKRIVLEPPVCLNLPHDLRLSFALGLLHPKQPCLGSFCSASIASAAS